jgi:hypothetical protein
MRSIHNAPGYLHLGAAALVKETLAADRDR